MIYCKECTRNNIATTNYCVIVSYITGQHLQVPLCFNLCTATIFRKLNSVKKYFWIAFWNILSLIFKAWLAFGLNHDLEPTYLLACKCLFQWRKTSTMCTSWAHLTLRLKLSVQKVFNNMHIIHTVNFAFLFIWNLYIL